MENPADLRARRTLDEPGWYQTAIAERRTGILIGDIGIHTLESFWCKGEWVDDHPR